MDSNASDIIKDNFDIINDPNGGKGDGMGILLSKKMFDREINKEYLIPINIIDSGSPAITGTSTMTVTIGNIFKMLKLK